MSEFKKVLASLPSIDELHAIELISTTGEAERLPNQPGKAGSLAVYNALLEEFGEINQAAAEKGLALFAEHTEDARAHPGKHPNIDRLLDIIESGNGFTARRIPKNQ